MHISCKTFFFESHLYIDVDYYMLLFMYDDIQIKYVKTKKNK